MRKHDKNDVRISIEEINKMLNIDSFNDLSLDVIDLAYEEAQNRVKALAATIDLIQDRMMTLLGWFTAAEISLIGVLVGLVSTKSPSPLPLTLDIYGVVALGAILVYLVRHGLYGTEVVEAGDTPKHFLDPEIVETLKEVKSAQDQKKRVKIMYLSMLQEAAMVNAKTNNRLVDVYRRVMWVVLGASLFGMILLVFMLVF